MTKSKIAISVPEEPLVRVHREVRAGRTSNGQNAHSRRDGIVLDTGALIDLDRGDKRLIALLQRVCGELRAAAGASDVIDASVVILARERRDPIIPRRRARTICGGAGEEAA